MLIWFMFAYIGTDLFDVCVIMTEQAYVCVTGNDLVDVCVIENVIEIVVTNARLYYTLLILATHLQIRPGSARVGLVG